MAGLEDLEKAATVLMAHPGLVSSEERHQAEQIFLEFRKTKQPYDICQNILKNCKVEYVLFEAATTLKEAIIREWALIDKSLIDNLCSFLLQYVTEKIDSPSFVREQILLVVAVIFKLGTLESPDARTSLFNGLNGLVSSGNKNMELICCSIMKALLTEYATTSQSTNFRMSLDFHAKCKKAFEEKDLLNLFVLTINALERYSASPLSSLAREDIALLNRYLSLAEQILLWEFMSGNPLLLLRFPHLNETATKIIFKPHKNWKDVMLNPNLIDLFFKLLQVTLPHDGLSHHCLQCMIQLASLAGGVFGSDEMQLNYLSHFMNGLLSALNFRDWSGHQASCLSIIIFRLVDVFPMKIIRSVNADIINKLFEAVTYLTCAFQEKAVTIPKDDLNDNEYAEASNTLLDAWITIVSHPDDFPPNLFKKYSAHIVETYLKCHLGAPDGARPENDLDDDIDHELEESDRDFYSDELSNIGHFARMNLHEVLDVLIQKFIVRIGHLRELFDYERARLNSASNGHNKIAVDILFEDIHWLLLISSYILTLDSTGESSQLPTEIIDSSNHFLASHTNCVSATVNYLSNKDGDISNVDPIVALFTCVLRLTELQTEFLKNNLASSYSPEVASSLLWFLKRWARGYIAGDMSQLKSCPVLKACFDLDTECGKHVLKFLLETAEINLHFWNGEPQVSEDVSSLLLRIFSNKKRVETALNIPTVWTIVKKFFTHDPHILALAPKVQRNILEGLMKACMVVPDEKTKEEFKTHLLQPIMETYNKYRQQENFERIAHKEEVRFTIIRTFECLRGIFPSCLPSFSDTLFQFFRPIIEDTVPFVLIYDNYSTVTVAMLEMYVDISEYLLCFLDTENTKILCKICIEMIKNFSKSSLSKRTIDSDQDEEKYNDLLLLIQLLSHILSKDFLDLGESRKDSENICPVDVSIYGLQIVIPLINEELLKYPKLSNEYFKLVTFLCEMYPEKIRLLPQDLYKTFMSSIQMALTDLNTDTAKCALDALSQLGKFLNGECDRNDPINQPLNDALSLFLNAIFEHIVLGHFNMELIEPASECFFLLICCHQQEYLKLANNLIAKQQVTNEIFQQRLIDAFQLLTPPDLQLSPNRQSVRLFRKNLETFLQNVKGFLCYK